MSKESFRMHELFDVAIEKTQGLDLPVTFRTETGIRITIKENSKNNGVAIIIEQQRIKHLAREEYLLLRRGGCKIHVSIETHSVTGHRVYQLQKTEEYTHVSVTSRYP